MVVQVQNIGWNYTISILENSVVSKVYICFCNSLDIFCLLIIIDVYFDYRGETIGELVRVKSYRQ